MPGYANPFLNGDDEPIADEDAERRESFRLNPPSAQQPNPFQVPGVPVMAPAAPWWADPPGRMR
jgi:hypothetical protein